MYGSSVDPNSNFGKFLTVVSSKCLTCHAAWGSLATESDWIAQGLVVRGSLAGSKIYYRLLGANLGVGVENMPTNSALTSTELEDVRTWILNM